MIVKNKKKYHDYYKTKYRVSGRNNFWKLSTYQIKNDFISRWEKRQE